MKNMVSSRHLILPLCCLTGLLYLPDITFAQDWPKIYGDNFHATIAKINETYDRGFLLSAYTYTTAGWPLNDWIIKIDINGNVLWEKQFGNGIYSNGVSDAITTIDHGLILAAGTSKYSGNYDPTFIKLNVCGEMDWCKVFKSPDQNYGTGIIQLADGSYIGMLKYYGEGQEYARINLVKLDPTGEPLWIQRLAQEDSLINNEEGTYLYLTSDSNYLISGWAYHPSSYPFWILTDTTGTQIWNLFWNSLVGEAHQVIEKDTGIFYSTSYGFGTNGIQSPVLLKFDNSGNPLDSYYLLGDTIVRGSAMAINSYNSANLLIGLTWSNIIFPVDYGFSEIFFTDTLGNLIKRRLLLNDDFASPNRIIVDSDQKILVTGNYFVDGNRDIYLWKMNSELEDDTLYTQPMTYDSLCPYQITSDTVDLDCELFVRIEDIPTKEQYESTIKISPNPARDWIMLTFPDNTRDGKMDIAIYNLFGQEVLRKETTSASGMVTLNVSGLSSGLYVVVGIDQRQRILKGKFVVAR